MYFRRWYWSQWHNVEGWWCCWLRGSRLCNVSGASLAAHVVQQPATHLATGQSLYVNLSKYSTHVLDITTPVQYSAHQRSQIQKPPKAAISRHIWPSQVPRPTCQSGKLTTSDPKPKCQTLRSSKNLGRWLVILGLFIYISKHKLIP